MLLLDIGTVSSVAGVGEATEKALFFFVLGSSLSAGTTGSDDLEGPASSTTGVLTVDFFFFALGFGSSPDIRVDAVVATEVELDEGSAGEASADL